MEGAARDDFPVRAKRILGERVRYRCSRCKRATIGPHMDPQKSATVGVAAHIRGAAAGGPRFDSGTVDRRALVDLRYLALPDLRETHRRGPRAVLRRAPAPVESRIRSGDTHRARRTHAAPVIAGGSTGLGGAIVRSRLRHARARAELEPDRVAGDDPADARGGSACDRAGRRTQPSTPAAADARGRISNRDRLSRKGAGGAGRRSDAGGRRGGPAGTLPARPRPPGRSPRPSRWTGPIARGHARYVLQSRHRADGD